MNEKIIKEKLQENFLRYLAISSQSDEKNENIPSSVGQLELAKLLKKELEDLDLCQIEINQYGVLQAKLPKRASEKSPIAWVAHLDTVDVGLSEKINPQIVKNYDGKDIILNKEEKKFFLRKKIQKFFLIWAMISYLQMANQFWELIIRRQ